MGKVIQAQCVKCEYKKEFFIGGGRSDCNIDTILNSLPDDKQSICEAELKNGAQQIFIRRELCRCEFCGEIYTQVRVGYTLNEIQQELISNCPTCGNAQSVLCDMKKSCKCSKCGAEVSFQQIGIWD